MVPGSYTQIDRSGLQSPGLGSSGVVAILGTAEGGRPVTEIDDPNDIPTFSRESQVRNYFRSGDLKDAANPLLFPSNDADIPGGAERVLFKTNNATQSYNIVKCQRLSHQHYITRLRCVTNGLAVQLVDDASSDNGSIVVRGMDNGAVTNIQG